MSGAVLRSRRGFAGPDEDTSDAVALLIEIQREASQALEEGAIDDAAYEAILAESDAIELRVESDPTAALLEAQDLAGRVVAGRETGRTSHRSSVAWAMAGAGLASILIVAGLTAWAGAAR
jgi:hypothetical protein